MGKTFGYREGDLPVTEELSGRLLRLPLYYDITEDEQRQVVTQIYAFSRKSRDRREVVRLAPALHP
jgi:dTDP-4-amino-4,6-dideoxygalactose transaminase